MSRMEILTFLKLKDNKCLILLSTEDKKKMPVENAGHTIRKFLLNLGDSCVTSFDCCFLLCPY